MRIRVLLIRSIKWLGLRSMVMCTSINQVHMLNLVINLPKIVSTALTIRRPGNIQENAPNFIRSRVVILLLGPM